MQEGIYLAGPTASGKSAVAIELAQRIGGEVISVDSMQVYRGMDIGTAKPTFEERKGIPHHLIDVVDLSETFDVARFVDLARKNEQEIRARGRIPIFCGGTGLYFNALVGGLSSSTPASVTLRRELEARAMDELLRELEEKDPESYARIDRSNPRRVVRAVEVLRTTGKPLKESRPDWGTKAPKGYWFGLEREREELYQRIEARVDAMFTGGLVHETEALVARGLRMNRTASQALGYRQVLEHLSGERDLIETISTVKQKTRQYAKRQLTWFRHQLPMQWIHAAQGTDPGALADQIAHRIFPQNSA